MNNKHTHTLCKYTHLICTWHFYLNCRVCHGYAMLYTKLLVYAYQAVLKFLHFTYTATKNLPSPLAQSHAHIHNGKTNCI